MAGNGAEQKKFSEKGYPEPVLSVYIGAGRGIWYQRLHGAAYSRAHSFIRGGAEAGCGLYSGAGLQGAEDGSPSLMLADRLEKGIELYESGASARLLMSGDHGRSEYDEVNTMKAFAVEQGVPSEAVFMDHAGFSTYDSIYRAKDVFQAEKIIVVSQEYHLSRALYIAERLGLDAYGVAAADISYQGATYRSLREAAARGKDFLLAWMQPQPKFLGEAVPVSGNGDLTNDKEM